MVWLRESCSAMDLKKLAFSDQFPYWVSRRRKVISGFGFGVVAFLIVLSVVLFNVSFKAPFLSPVFRGFNSFRGSNISVVPWHFSFPITSAPFSSTANTSSGATSTASIVPTDEEFQKSDGLIPRVGEGEVFDKAQKGIGSVMGKDRNIPGSDGEGINSGVTRVGNFSGKVKNGSSLEEEGMGEEKSQFVNGLSTGKNAGFKNDTEEGAGLERTHLGNSSEKVRSGSFNGGDMVQVKSVTEGNVDKTHANGSISLNKPPGITVNSNIGKNKVNDHGGNWSHNDNVGCPGKELCFSEIQNQKSSSATNNIAASYNNSRPMEGHNGSYGKCDLFDGRWVRDYTKPYYPAGSCPYIDRDFDCHLNRRPDDGFVKWKWQPYGCDIPSLNATDFLERLRGKNLVFVGDSLNRNMWESLVCILRHSIRNKKTVYEISGRRDFKKKGFYAFRFEDYNCSVDFVSSPFLVRESSFIGRNGSFETLRLDLMDRTTSMYRDADVVVFNTGHWWTHEKTSRGEDYYQEGKHVYPRLKVLEAYKKALYTWARWVDKNIDGSRTEVIFRGYSVTHFRGGQWNSGGQCHKETEPFFNETYLANYPSKMRVLEHVLREMRTPVIYLNISRLTDYRKDGHPSIYRKEYKTVKEQIAAEQSQDCSHWCLPGVPDTWNELLYFSLLQAGKGSWRS